MEGSLKYYTVNTPPYPVDRIDVSIPELYLLSNYITGSLMDKKGCDEVLQGIKDIEENNESEGVENWGGNDISAYIYKDGVQILQFGEMIEYPLGIFKKAIEEWSDFMVTGKERTVELEW